MQQDIKIREVLNYINPAELNYQEWCSVGMALQHDGYDVSLWDEWSRRDSARYHQGECAKKYQTFHGAANPVTIATVVQMAKDNGYMPFESRELDWNDEIGRKDDLIIVNKNWIEAREITEPGDDWNPAEELITYLETLFEPTDKVGYTTRSWSKPDSNKRYPDKGCWDRTAGQLIKQLSKCNNDIGSVLGDYYKDTGAWIRFNPLDGHGVRNENVSDFRYALVESDETAIEHQNAIIRELELPVAALVYSGKKSIHAIVRVEAANYEEYRKRVDYLYSVCQKNGLKIDSQNRNPSRLSRMPGVMRGNKKQFLIATNIGKQSWDEWREWIESVNDDLPEPEPLDEVWNNIPELSPALIDGVLRQGHKMLVAGPSKAGKSYALIELCIAIAEGTSWLGFNCAKGKIMYVNLELDRASCLHRFKDVYNALNLRPDNLSNLDIWNLRGKSIPMDKLAPKLIRRALKKNYIAVVIDPIYKVITGDENSADQMAKFCNQFDKVCTELGCAVIYCHHHSKGAQGGKRSMDRASGSGVFARDPDALLDLIELELNENILRQEENKAICSVCESWLKRFVPDYKSEVSQDDLCSTHNMQEACKRLLPSNSCKLMADDIQTAKRAVQSRTAWRIEGTLREFPKFPPVNVWFDYPIHRIDSVGSLKDIETDSEKPPWQRASEKRKKSAKSAREEINSSLEIAYASLSVDGQVTLKALAEYWNGMTEKGVKDRIKKSGKFYYENGIVYEKDEGEGK